MEYVKRLIGFRGWPIQGVSRLPAEGGRWVGRLRELEREGVRK